MSLDTGGMHGYTRAGSIDKKYNSEQFWVLYVQVMCNKKAGESAVIHCSRQIHLKSFCEGLTRLSFS